MRILLLTDRVVPLPNMTDTASLVDWLTLLFVPISILSGFVLATRERKQARRQSAIDDAERFADGVADAAGVAKHAADYAEYIVGVGLEPGDPANDPECPLTRFVHRWDAWVPVRLEGLITALGHLDPKLTAKARLTQHQLTLVARLTWLRNVGENIATHSLSDDQRALFKEVITDVTSAHSGFVAAADEAQDRLAALRRQRVPLIGDFRR